MNDLTITTSHELDVAQITGNTEAGGEFVDRWLQDDLAVVDSGTILVRGTALLEAQAIDEGLTIERELVASERGSR